MLFALFVRQRNPSTDRGTRAWVRFDLELAIHKFHSFLHADKSESLALDRHFGIKTNPGITNRKVYSLRRSNEFNVEMSRAAVFCRIVERFLQNSVQTKRNLGRQ